MQLLWMFMLFVSHFAALCLAFSSKMPCIQHQNTLCFAPKRTPFCTKTHAIQHQNALHLAPKRTAFSGKTHYIQHQTAQNLLQMVVSWNRYSFCIIRRLTPFCTRTNSSKNRFFAASWTFGRKKGSNNVKVFTKKRTKIGQLRS